MSDLRRALLDAMPREVRLALSVRRSIAYWRKAGVVFIHVPKAAGTSVSVALYGRFLGHPTARQVRRYAPELSGVVPTFAITRNPWDRCVSAYRFALAGRGQGSGPVAGIFRPEQYQVPAFRSFEAFVREWLTQQDLDRCDHVFRCQSRYVSDHAGNLLVDHLGSVEALAVTETYLSDVLGRPVSIARHNVSGELVDYRTWYTHDLVDAVAGVYADDITSFGYDF
jgi:hypothetical protein